MTIRRRLCATVIAIPLLLSTVCGQEQTATGSSASAIVVTATANTDWVRFTAPSTVVQMRIEVYAANGEKLFDNEIRGGNIFDWHLQDGQAGRLWDGSYLCVITTKSVSGRLSQKLGKITIENTVPSVQPTDTIGLTAQQKQAVGPLEENASLTVLKEGENQTATVIAHNGEEGQITRGRGALSFRIGDFFSGKDTEQMRLTADGNFGIGLAHPQARLDVDGLIRTSKGIVFPDGTIQTTAANGARDVQASDPNMGGGKLLGGAVGLSSSSVKNGKGKDKAKVSPEFNVDEDLTINGNIIFTPSLARDITVQNNNGGIRIFGAPTLTSSPAGAAIQFFGNGQPSFPGQAYIDSGANNNAAVIFRTAGTGATITERMRITATGNVGIGTTTPSAPLHVEGGDNGAVLATSSTVAVYGSAGLSSGTGVIGRSYSWKGVSGVSSIDVGVEGRSGAAHTSTRAGVVGYSYADGGIGVYGVANLGNAWGVFGASTSATGKAGHFEGNVDIIGSLSKSSGSFKIDHPIDPANKYLYHSFVESPDMMNIYNGNITTDENGDAVVTLPGYFQALNRDFRYQLTVIGQFAQAIVSSEIDGNRFTIKSDKPEVKLSWQVTGVRKDAYAEAHRIQVEVDKPEKERGYYVHPTLFGQPAERSVDRASRPEVSQPKKEAQPQP